MRSHSNFTRQIFPRNLWILVTSSSLYNFKVMQNSHDVLGHEDVASVQGHPHHGNQHRIEHGSLPGLQHVERSDQQVLVVEPGHLLPCSLLSIQSATSHSFPYSTIMVLKSHTCCEECGTDFVRSNLKLCFLLHLILQKHMMVDCWLFLPSFPLWQSFVM